MSKNEWLSKETKTLIGDLCRNTKRSYSEIGDFLGIDRRTASKYKSYRSKLTRIKKSPSVTDLKRIEDQKEQALFQMIYDDCKKTNRFFGISSLSHMDDSYRFLYNFISDPQSNKNRYYQKLSRLKKYNSLSKNEIICDVIRILYTNYKNNNKNVIVEI